VVRSRTLAFFAMFIVTFVASCQERPKPMRRLDELDGGYDMREECYAPIDDCLQGCYHREASSTCYGCCMDQRFLCDMQRPYSIAYCESAR